MTTTISGKRFFGAMLLSAAAFAACERMESGIPATPEVYTMTVTASKSADDVAKALVLDEKTLGVRWDEGEEVEVVQDQDGYKVLGKLYAKASETGSTTLSGTLEAAPTNTSNLLFYLHGSTQDYTGQTGVLLSDGNSIEKKYDYAYASARWSPADFIVDEDSKTVTVPDGLSFESSQAIVKFTLVDEISESPLNVTSLTISDFRKPGTVDVNNIVLNAAPGAEATCGDLVITPASATGEIYVAIRREYETLYGFSKFTLTAETAEGISFNYEKSFDDNDAGKIFDSGNYYEITVKMAGGEGAGNGFTVNDSGKKVLFSQGNLQATYDGSSWTWAFAENQWDFVGDGGEAAVGNELLIASSPYITSPGVVDLFGWVGASSNWTGVAQNGITARSFRSVATPKNGDSYGYVAGEGLKQEWGTLPITNAGSYTWRTPADAE